MGWQWAAAVGDCQSANGAEGPAADDGRTTEGSGGWGASCGARQCTRSEGIDIDYRNESDFRVLRLVS